MYFSQECECICLRSVLVFVSGVWMYLSRECECICVHTGIGLLVWAELLPDRILNQIYMYLFQECECICLRSVIVFVSWVWMYLCSHWHWLAGLGRAAARSKIKSSIASPSPPSSLLAPTPDWTMITMITYDQCHCWATNTLNQVLTQIKSSIAPLLASTPDWTMIKMIWLL